MKKRIIIFALTIIGVNICVYWLSFFHVFRHDDWFLFFSSRHDLPDWHFLVKYFDWNLQVPYDRMSFRPLSTAAMALNRVLFDANYIGPHILTFIKHLTAAILLWLNMWRIKKEFSSFLFALLFSLLTTGIDPVIWPHVDSYIMGTIFILFAMLTFRLTINSNVRPTTGFIITGIAILLGMLSSQTVLVAPFAFLIAYYFCSPQKNMGKAFWWMFFAPLFLWSALFLIHLNLAYPFNMGLQSKMISLPEIILNIPLFIIVLFTADFFPLRINMMLADKIYFCTNWYSILILFLLFAAIFVTKLIVINFKNKALILPSFLLIFVAALICFSRATYINTYLSKLAAPSYVVYPVNALIILLIYTLIDFGVPRSKKIIYLILICLIVVNARGDYQACNFITKQTVPLRSYFDVVRTFVGRHKNEPDFSFMITDPLPGAGILHKIGKIFWWYRATCIDGLFARYINNNNPKYLLEGDYYLDFIKESLYNKELPSQMPRTKDASALLPADYTNSIGIRFKKIVMDNREFLMGICEVTQKQWQEVMGYNPSQFIGENYPVENVSYQTAIEFIRRLNNGEGHSLYRLPTEQEYNYLLNAALEEQGLGISNIPPQIMLKYRNTIAKLSLSREQKFALLLNAVLEEQKQGILDILQKTLLNTNTTHPAGETKGLPRGIYDLAGNVWEWTDSPVYYESEIAALKDTPHICFGGSYRENPDVILQVLKFTTCYPIDFSYRHLGFRLVKDHGAD